MIPVAGKEDSNQIIEPVHSFYFVVAYFDFRAWNVFHPAFLMQISLPKG